MPANLFSPGRVGMLSRSGTLAYEVAGILQAAGVGISTMIGVGGDPIIGTDMEDYLPRFAEDPQTEALLVVGEIGGTQEERVGGGARTVRTSGLCVYRGSYGAARKENGACRSFHEPAAGLPSDRRRRFSSGRGFVWLTPRGVCPPCSEASCDDAGTEGRRGRERRRGPGRESGPRTKGATDERSVRTVCRCRSIERRDSRV